MNSGSGDLLRSCVASLAMTVGIAMASGAQAPISARGNERARGRDSSCSYTACGLAIVPRWNGLAVIQGTNGPRVANLNFFWPRSITAALRDGSGGPAADSATARAQHALQLRRVGAAFTDAGVIAAVAAGARIVASGRTRRVDKVAAGASIASLLVSVPLQFAADGELSRAVWWHNVRFMH
jgi:hypothetical protein